MQEKGWKMTISVKIKNQAIAYIEWSQFTHIYPASPKSEAQIYIIKIATKLVRIHYTYSHFNYWLALM